MEYQSLAAMLISQAHRYGNKELYRFAPGGHWRSLTWADALAQVREIAMGLVSLGIGRGDRVAILSNIGSSGIWWTGPTSA